MEWLKGRDCIDDDGHCIVADAEEASNLDRGTKEGAAKVLGVVEEENLLDLWNPKAYYWRETKGFPPYLGYP